MLFKRLKRIFAIILVILVFGGTVYLYFTLQALIRENQNAKMIISKAQQFDKLNNEITSEKNRCQSYIGSGVGDFGQFEYCKRFLEWSASIQK